jgi:hypothetical protein
MVMGKKLATRRGKEMRKQIVHWPYELVMKVPKGSKSSVKELVTVHKPIGW